MNESTKLLSLVNQAKHSRSHSQIDIDKLNNVNIKFKKQNPFWIPNQNSDLFKMKEIIKEENLLKKHKIKLFESKNKSNINTYFYRDNLINGADDNLLKNASVVMGNLTTKHYNENNIEHTEQTQLPNINSNPTLNSGIYLTERQLIMPNTSKNLPPKLLITDDREKQGRDRQGRNSQVKQEDLNQLMNRIVTGSASPEIKINDRDKSRLLGGRNGNSVKDFISKTKDIILLNFNTKIKEERVTRLKENLLDKIEQCNENIFSLEKSKELFCEEFFTNFSLYCKKIQSQLEIEICKLGVLNTKCSESLGAKKLLETKIYKYKEKLSYYLQYKLFLMNLKKHRIIYNLDNNEVIHFKNEMLLSIKEKEKDKDDNSNSLNNSKIDEERLSKVNLDNFRPTKGINYVNNEKLIQRLLSDDIQQFRTAEEIVEELKRLEIENLSSLTRYDNAVKGELVADRELTRYKIKHQEDLDQIQNDLDSRTSYNNKLRDKNRSLKREIESILNPTIVNVKKTAKMEKMEANLGDNFDTLKNKILTLYQTLFSFYSKKVAFDPANNDYIKNKAINKSTSYPDDYLIDMLYFNEKTFLFLYDNYNQIKSTNGDKLAIFEKELEKRRQEKNSEIQKIIYAIKIKEIKDKLASKNANIILPMRKIARKQRPTEKVRSSSMSVQSKENQFIDFLRPLET